MSHQVVRIKREAVAPCMTCPLCNRLFRNATTIIECLHTFCRRCIRQKLKKEKMKCCPLCDVDLGCAPLDKLRPDHNLRDIRAKFFPHKRLTSANAPEAGTPVIPHAKRKKRSLSSLVDRSPQVALTGRRSNLVSRKRPQGSKNFTIVDSQEMSTKFTHNLKQNHPSTTDIIPGETTHSSDIWRPLNCLAEAANRSSNSSKSEEEQHSHDNEGLTRKASNKDRRKKARVNDETSDSDYTPSESEKPRKLRKVHQEAQDSGELRASPQFILDAGSDKHETRNYPIWFALVASDEKEGDLQPLPQISARYLRIKDGAMPVSFIQKYLQRKLDLPSEVEVEIKCMGQTVIPTLTLNNLVHLWLQTTTREEVSVTVGSSAKDFVMVLTYARRVRGY